MSKNILVLFIFIPLVLRKSRVKKIAANFFKKEISKCVTQGWHIVLISACCANCSVNPSVFIPLNFFKKKWKVAWACVEIVPTNIKHALRWVFPNSAARGPSNALAHLAFLLHTHTNSALYINSENSEIISGPPFIFLRNYGSHVILANSILQHSSIKI